MHQEKIAEVIQEVKKVVVGQDKMINRLLIGLFTNGHILLEGVPGLAKTLTVNTLAKVLHLDFKRIQFTPDLLPSDLIGTMIYNQQTSNFEVKKGPIFSNVILADEVNRSPAKVQSALLEAMQEKQVTIGDTTYPLDKPFLVLATQNPVEQEGTFPLPEAQVDRFMLKVFLNYLDKDQELAVMRQKSNMDFNYEPKTVLNAEDIAKIRKEINDIAEGNLDYDNNPVKNSPHTLNIISSDDWNKPYTRKQAAFPLDYVSSNKFWPTVSRVDDAYGDRNLICTCAPIEAYM